MLNNYGGGRDEGNYGLRLVVDYGPKSCPARVRFNEQDNGQSAMWFALANNDGSDLIVEFDGKYLKSARSENVLSAFLPDDLLMIPRKVLIRVFDADYPVNCADLDFQVTGENIGRRTPDELADVCSINAPNFFIVGAPRSGTTTMYWELSAHPEIFMSRVKEPFFFDERAHGVLTGAIESESVYRELFRYTPIQAKIVGEASTTYLSSRHALEKIHAFSSQARIVVMLRNPIEAAVSFYSQMRRGGSYEDQPDFEAAWHCGEKAGRIFLTNYREIFRIGSQLLAAVAIFGRENVKVTFFDDLVDDSRSVYRDIISFLGLEGGPDRVIPRTNSSGVRDVRSVVEEGLLAEMIQHFRPEVGIVASYTGRRLCHWLEL